jgi:hypothetical protein
LKAANGGNGNQTDNGKEEIMANAKEIREILEMLRALSSRERDARLRTGDAFKILRGKIPEQFQKEWSEFNRLAAIWLCLAERKEAWYWALVAAYASMGDSVKKALDRYDDKDGAEISEYAWDGLIEDARNRALTAQAIKNRARQIVHEETPNITLSDFFNPNEE